jgi:predicted dehydrogenase
MTLPKPPLRVAILGAGLASAPYFKSLATLSDRIQVVWVLGRQLEKLAAITLPQGAQATTSEHDIFDDSSVDAVFILTPANTHLHFTRLAAQAGNHVLLEKPLEVSLDLATQLVSICETAGVVLGVMLQHRMRKGATALRQLVGSGRLGSVISASANIRWWRAQSYYDAPGRGTLERDGGGVLITQALHTLDLLLCLTGMPRRIHAHASTSTLHHMACEDTVGALLHFDNGTIATVQATTAAYPGYAEHIEINGTLGTATLHGGDLSLHFADGTSQDITSSEGGGSGSDPMAFDHSAHQAVIANFVDAVQLGGPVSASGRSALNVSRLIHAIMSSANHGGATQTL